MRLGGRKEMTLIGAAALAVAVPLLCVWPAREEIIQGAAPILTPVAAVQVALTGAEAARPLFSASRSLQTVVDTASLAAEPAPSAPPDPPRVVGLIASRGAGLALVRLLSGETITIQPGEDADGWRLLTVTASHATFRMGSTQTSVPLDYRSREAAGPSSAAQGAIPSPPLTYSPARPISGPTGN